MSSDINYKCDILCFDMSVLSNELTGETQLDEMNSVLETWASIIGVSIDMLKISQVSLKTMNSSLSFRHKQIPANELASWKLYKSHRDDTADWLPYYVTQVSNLRIYYINVNPKSPYYNHFITVCDYGLVCTIDLRDGKNIVNSQTIETHTD